MPALLVPALLVRSMLVTDSQTAARRYFPTRRWQGAVMYVSQHARIAGTVKFETPVPPPTLPPQAVQCFGTVGCSCCRPASRRWQLSLPRKPLDKVRTRRPLSKSAPRVQTTLEQLTRPTITTRYRPQTRLNHGVLATLMQGSG